MTRGMILIHREICALRDLFQHVASSKNQYIAVDGQKECENALNRIKDQMIELEKDLNTLAELNGYKRNSFYNQNTEK